jgi:transcriptional regulator with XRE-family HTH domain
MNPGQRLRLFGVVRFGTASGSVKAFAEAISMKPSNLQKYLCGDREPGASVLARVADLGCNVHWLVTGDGEMYAASKVGEEVKRRLSSSGLVAEPGTQPQYPVAESDETVAEEIERVRGLLGTAKQTERGALLEQLNRLLETRVEMLQQENMLHKGEIVAFEKILSKLKVH